MTKIPTYLSSYFSFGIFIIAGFAFIFTMFAFFFKASFNSIKDQITALDHKISAHLLLTDARVHSLTEQIGNTNKRIDQLILSIKST